MLRFLSKSLRVHKVVSDSDIISSSGSFFHLRSISSEGSQTLTVSYLVNSCGLSLDSALKASKSVHIKTIDRPNAVLDLLKAHGFTKPHISRLVSKYPALILVNSEKTLRPKIEFFESLGVVGPDLPNILCKHTLILRTSLKNQIIPKFDFLKGFVRTNDNLICMLKRSSRTVSGNTWKFMERNISILRSHGVPESHIAKLIMVEPDSLLSKNDVFDEVANATKEMGFEPSSQFFIFAIRSMVMLSKVKWEKKRDLLTRLGWSKTIFNLAFRKQPMLMLCSEKKIEDVMNFLVNKVLLKPSDIARCPNLFLASLEKRTIPRCLVLEILMSKELISKNVDVVWVLNATKQKFDTRFIDPFKHIAPEIIKAYEGEIDSQIEKSELKDRESV